MVSAMEMRSNHFLLIDSLLLIDSFGVLPSRYILVKLFHHEEILLHIGLKVLFALVITFAYET